MKEREVKRGRWSKSVGVALLTALMLLVPMWAAVAPAAAAPAAAIRRIGPDLAVSDSDLSGVTLELTFPEPETVEVLKDGVAFQRLVMRDYGTTAEVGQPELPAVGRYLAIPRGARVEVEVLDAQFETRQGYHIYPAQEPLNETNDEVPAFALNRDAYASDHFYPGQVAQIDSEAVIRGYDAAIIRFYPVQYNPATSELRVYTSARVRVSFVGGSRAGLEARLASPYFEDLFSSMVVNAEAVPAPAERPSGGAQLASEGGCEFLIITHPDFLAAANRLADWKRQKGIDTEVRTTGDTGGDAASIRAYIQAAYNGWNPAPTFVLFLGDAEFVPTNYITPHAAHSNTLIGTDLYYATVAGTDYFPDISTGRIPVDTSAQAEAVVTKIVDYERTPPADPAFYSNVTLAAYFQDVSPVDGYDERPFIKTSEVVRDFLANQGYNVQRIYEAPTSSNPTNYYVGTFANGEPLPDELLRSNGFVWDGNATQVSAAINAGTVLVNHRDHGGYALWGHPYYNTGHVAALTNGSKLPVVLSMNCQTGWFDDETDDYPTYSWVSLAETFLRHENGGAVGVVAATRTSYSGHNDAIDMGIIDAIWPDFLSYGQAGAFANPQRRMGQALNYGKLYYATLYAESTYRKYEFEIFHYFGDPTMQIWASAPAEMNVSHADHVEPGATSFDVNVDVEGAMVTVVKGSTLLGKATAADGAAQVLLSPAPEDGELVVTAVDLDYAPYEDDVPVGAPTSVRLTSLAARPGQKGVLLTWETGQEINNLGFNIYRSRTQDISTAAKINAEMIPSQAFGSIVGASYAFTDTGAKAGVTYYYWLEDVDAFGSGSGLDLDDVTEFGPGAWNMPAPVKVYPNAGSVVALSGQRFGAFFQDRDGDLAYTYLLINSVPELKGGLAVRYEVGSGLMSMYDQRIGQWLPGVAPGVANSLGCPFGALRAYGSSVEFRDEGIIAARFQLKFWARFVGEHQIWLMAEDAAGNSSGWQPFGNWQVQAP